jgi:hypothetical protein
MTLTSMTLFPKHPDITVHPPHIMFYGTTSCSAHTFSNSGRIGSDKNV